jgi:hypothetical protein
MDLKAKYLWSLEEVVGFMNESATEVAVRSLCIEKDSIEIEFSAAQEKGDIPDHVYRIQRAAFGGRKIELTDYQTLDEREGPGWESRTGTPVAVYEVGSQLRPYPIPDADGVISLTAFCTPEGEMESSGDEPEGIPSRMHPYMIDWALHLAYSKLDADTFDANLSEVFKTRFAGRFGEAREERAERSRRINVRRFSRGAFF